MYSEILIKFPSDGTSEVFVFKEEMLLFSMKRKFHAGSKITAEIYQNEKLLVKVWNFAFMLKITEQHLDNKILIKNNNLLFSKILIGNNEVIVRENPLYFVNRHISTILCNSKVVGKVRIKKILDWDGITLVVSMADATAGIESDIILAYLLTCLNLNI
ncbi:MAG TPA: hypothetical protein VF581_08835 [Flavobacterium sp.]|jgi:hypothetical protein